MKEERSGTTEFGGGANANCASSPSGAASCGTVYKVTRGGFETLLHRFRGGKYDGANPTAGLLAGNNGVVYGVTEYGGGTGSGPGTVFELTLSSRRHTVSILHKFCWIHSVPTASAPWTQRVYGAMRTGIFTGRPSSVAIVAADAEMSSCCIRRLPDMLKRFYMISWGRTERNRAAAFCSPEKITSGVLLLRGALPRNVRTGAASSTKYGNSFALRLNLR